MVTRIWDLPTINKLLDYQPIQYRKILEILRKSVRCVRSIHSSSVFNLLINFQLRINWNFTLIEGLDSAIKK